jgi:hypothetical protein
VVLFAPSGKTAVTMADLLRHGRPSAQQPRKVIGVTSPGSRAFVEGTGLYDKVMLYEDTSSADLTSKLHIDNDTKVVFLDFGGRNSAAAAWSAAIKPLCNQLRQVTIASEVKHISPEEATKDIMSCMADSGGGIQASGSEMRDRAMKLVGEKAYFDGFLYEWKAFKKRGNIKGLKLLWGEDMQSVYTAWDELAKGEIGPDKGLLFTL